MEKYGNYFIFYRKINYFLTVEKSVDNVDNLLHYRLPAKIT